MKSILAVVITSILCGLLDISAAAAAEQQVDFNRDIRPLFSNRCLTCHGPDAAERVSELRLDTEIGSRVDLGGYAAIVPGKPAESVILDRLTTDDPDLRMPPPGNGQRLTDEEVVLVTRWIEQGAKFAAHWSYQPPVRPPLPAVQFRDWVRNPIDHFILARLESIGRQPSARADRFVLARRAALDLTGLPPSWQEAAEFAADPRVNAYELYVDRQLAKPSFGERWARVWLDLARYADSAGYADDPPRTIWAYRDYVIRSLNANKSFDQFTIEQIAGDLLHNPSEEQLVATAFHRNTLTNNEGGTNDEEFRNVAVVDRVNTTMAVWMGTTMACAQCHTHKYDPITHNEYFQFFAFFNNTEDRDQRDERPTLAIFSDQQRSRQQQLRDEIDQLQATIDTPTAALAAAQQEWLGSYAAEPKWTTMVPEAATAQQRTLSFDQQGWIHATGDRPDHERYTLQFPIDRGRVTALRVEVPADQAQNFVLSQVKVGYAPHDNRPIAARYVRVDLPGDNRFLHLAEIEVLSNARNVALLAAATQSSTAYGGAVQRAIDGNTNGDYHSNSVTHTAQQTDPWIELDLGSVHQIDTVKLWNRTDGGKPISERILGVRLSLLDQDRNLVWQQTSPEFPERSQLYSPAGAVEWTFADASADFQQDGFPASSVLTANPDAKQGWAVAPQTGKSHQLILTLANPITVDGGVLKVQMVHQSVHSGLLLDHFRWSRTGDAHVTQWAAVPGDVRAIMRREADQRSASERDRLAAYYRTVAPLLAPTRRALAAAEQQLAEITPLTTVPVMRQLAEAARRTTKVQIRGNYLSTAEEVGEGTPATFHPLPADVPRDRLALARWLVDNNNPLTARVTANRHWEQIFGRGIVETSEEFGSQGELPTHPLLLDWLAVELQQSGWDLKHLLKLLVTSATYQQSSAADPQRFRADPDNRLYGRGPRFRISAEMVRDQALSASGLLSNKMFGPPVRPPQPTLGLSAAFGSKTDWATSDGDDRYRRAIYTTWRRSSPYPSLAQFDAPNREVCTVRRIPTNTPLQALVTLNDPVYVEAAQALARAAIAAGESPRQRIEYAVRACLIRDPSAAEIRRLATLAADARQRFVVEPAAAKQLATEPIGPLPAGADAAEYAAWTVVANVILNLDEMFLKR